MNRFFALPLIFFYFFLNNSLIYPKAWNPVNSRNDSIKKIKLIKKEISVEERRNNFLKLEKFYYELGKEYGEIEDYMNSLNSLYISKKYFEKANRGLGGKIYFEIARIYRILGREGITEKYLGLALTNSVENRNYNLQVSVYNLYGDVATERGEFQKALEYYQLSIGIISTRSLVDKMYDTSYRMALLLLKSGETEIGVGILKDVIDISFKEEYYLGLLPRLYHYLNFIADENRLVKFEEYLKKADEIFAPFYNHYYFLDFLKGLLEEKRGNMKLALKYYRKSLFGLDRYFAGVGNQIHYKYKTEILEIYSEIARFFFKMFDATNRVLFLRQAVYISEIKNTYIYKWRDSGKKSYNFISTELSRIKKEIRVIKDEKNNRSFERDRKLGKLESEKMEVNEIFREIPVAYKKFRFSELNSSRVRSRLENNTVILKFVVLKDNIFVISMDKKSIGYKKLKIPAKQIFKDINLLMKPFEDYSDGKVDLLRIRFDIRLSHKIYMELLHDILEFQKNKKRIYIIPDAVLFKLPFEALVTGFNLNPLNQNIFFSEYRNADFLTEKYSISYFFSLFHFLNKRRTGNKKYSISAFGSPDVNRVVYSGNTVTGRNNKLGALPTSKTEIEKIRNIYGNDSGIYLTGKDFTEKNFKKYSQKSDIIHIATHYIRNKELPEYSALLFSAESGSNPFFYIYNISGMKLKNTLVVVSACDSAEGELGGGQSLKGLASAFYKAGSSSMISSLWPVDQFNSRIMQEFYRRLKRSKINAGNLTKTLRMVKLNFMEKILTLKNGVRISCRNPLLWANFVLYNFGI